MLFWPKTAVVPENNSGRECHWPYLVGQRPLSPFLAKSDRVLPTIATCSGPACFWPFYVPFWWITRLLEQFNTGHKNNCQQNFAQVTWRLIKISHFSSNNFGANHLFPCRSGECSEALLDAFGLAITPARTTRRTYEHMSTERCIDCRQSAN